MAVHARTLDSQFQLLQTSIPTPASTPRVVESALRPLPDPPPVPPGEHDAIRNLRASLEASIASKLTSGSELVRALARQRREEILPTTIEPLDALLGGGLARGKMTEIAGRGTRFQLVIIDSGTHRPPGRRVPDAAWVRLARVAESHGATILVSAPYALTGTTSEAMILAYAAHARWLGRGNAPRVLAGIETRLK